MQPRFGQTVIEGRHLVDGSPLVQSVGRLARGVCAPLAWVRYGERPAVLAAVLGGLPHLVLVAMQAGPGSVAVQQEMPQVHPSL